VYKLVRLPYPLGIVRGAILNPDPRGSTEAQGAHESTFILALAATCVLTVSSKQQEVQLARLRTSMRLPSKV
jgi:hypothetical protein